MADPGFPVGGGVDLVGGGRGLLRRLRFVNFVCQNERIGSLHPARAPLNPPMSMIMTCAACAQITTRCTKQTPPNKTFRFDLDCLKKRFHLLFCRFKLRYLFPIALTLKNVTLQVYHFIVLPAIDYS